MLVVEVSLSCRIFYSSAKTFLFYIYLESAINWQMFEFQYNTALEEQLLNFVVLRNKFSNFFRQKGNILWDLCDSFPF